MDAFDFFFQGKFKILAQESGLNSVFFIMQFLITSFSAFVTIVITYDTFFKDIHIITFLVILLGIILGFILKLIAFGFIKNKKKYFLSNLFPLYVPEILFPKSSNFLNKNMRYMYFLWVFCWYSIGYSIHRVKIGEGGFYYFVILFFGFCLPLINYLLFLRFEYYKLFGKE